MKTTSTAPLSQSLVDRPTRRAAEYVDSGWDDLGPDPVEDYGGRAGRLADEDNAW